MKQMTVGSEEWLEIIIMGGRDMGIAVLPEQARDLAKHCELLLEWNQKTNLTAIVDPHEVAVKHVLDSLAPSKWIPDPASVLDLGTGGGFPGIPLKILKPSLKVTLVDASGKKVNFVKHVIRTLKLNDCEGVAGRIETMGSQREFTGKFQVVVSRSLAELNRLIPWAMPFLGPEGRIIALKGKNADKEMEALLKNGEFQTRLFHIQTEYYSLPRSDAQRALVVFEKRPPHPHTVQ